ncbi:MAG TPA: flavodoxin family protein [Bacillota bacterium]|jgi:multimeric flavodoxin WrbA|nr:flavodoxin family protein [Bacillota bacterium]
MKNRFTVVGVISSPRPQGNTAVMVREALKGAEEEGAIVEEVFLADIRMEFCKGCLTCLKSGKCCIADDFNALRDLLYNADAIILGSPTYGANVNATMKNLIDRLGMYEAATSSLGGKYIAGISAANSSAAAKKTAKTLSHFGNTGTFSRTYTSGFLGAGFSGGRQASNEQEILRKARLLGKKIACDIKKGRKYLFQNIPGRIISSMLMRPAFSKYIIENKEADTEVLYTSLKNRNLIT